MALEQSVFDAGDWGLAYVLALIEDPPPTMFQDKMASLTAAGRPFSPLVPPQRDRSATIQEGRCTWKEAARRKGSGGELLPFAEEEAKISEEAKGPHRGLGKPTNELESEFNREDDEPLTAWPGDPGRDLRRESLNPQFREGSSLPRPPRSPLLEGGKGETSIHSPNHLEAGLSRSRFLESRQANFPMWCSILVKLVLRSRSSFSAFLSSTIRISKQMEPRLPGTPSLFPVPIPSNEIGRRMPTSISQSRRKRSVIDRALHTICMALNFWHYGGEFSCIHNLWREPNRQHEALYDRVRSFIKTDGLLPCFDALKAGRRNPEIFARLGELTELLTRLGCSSSPYDKVFAGTEMTANQDLFQSSFPIGTLTRVVFDCLGKDTGM